MQCIVVGYTGLVGLDKLVGDLFTGAQFPQRLLVHYQVKDGYVGTTLHILRGQGPAQATHAAGDEDNAGVAQIAHWYSTSIIWSTVKVAGR